MSTQKIVKSTKKTSEQLSAETAAVVASSIIGTQVQAQDISKNTQSKKLSKKSEEVLDIEVAAVPVVEVQATEVDVSLILSGLVESADSDVSLVANDKNCKINNKGQEECDSGSYWWLGLLGLGAALAGGGGGGGGSSVVVPPAPVTSNTYRHVDFDQNVRADDTLNISATSFSTVNLVLDGSEHDDVETDAVDFTTNSSDSVAYNYNQMLAVDFEGSNNIQTFNTLVTDGDVVGLRVDYSAAEDLSDVNILVNESSELYMQGGNYIESDDITLTVTVTDESLLVNRGSEERIPVAIGDYSEDGEGFFTLSIDGDTYFGSDDGSFYVDISGDADAVGFVSEDGYIYFNDVSAQWYISSDDAVYVNDIDGFSYSDLVDVSGDSATVEILASDDSSIEVNGDVVQVIGNDAVITVDALTDSTINSITDDVVYVSGDSADIQLTADGVNSEITAEESDIVYVEGNNTVIQVTADNGSYISTGGLFDSGDNIVDVDGHYTDVTISAAGGSVIESRQDMVNLYGHDASVTVSAIEESSLYGNNDDLVEINGNNAVVSLTVDDSYVGIEDTLVEIDDGDNASITLAFTNNSDVYYGEDGAGVSVDGDNLNLAITVTESYVYGEDQSLVSVDGDDATISLTIGNGGEVFVDDEDQYGDEGEGNLRAHVIQVDGDRAIVNLSLISEEDSDDFNDPELYTVGQFADIVNITGDEAIVTVTVVADSDSQNNGADSAEVSADDDFVEIIGNAANLDMEFVSADVNLGGDVARIVGNDAVVNLTVSIPENEADEWTDISADNGLVIIGESAEVNIDLANTDLDIETQFVRVVGDNSAVEIDAHNIQYNVSMDNFVSITGDNAQVDIDISDISIDSYGLSMDSGDAPFDAGFVKIMGNESDISLRIANDGYVSDDAPFNFVSGDSIFISAGDLLNIQGNSNNFDVELLGLGGEDNNYISWDSFPFSGVGGNSDIVDIDGDNNTGSVSVTNSLLTLDNISDLGASAAGVLQNDGSDNEYTVSIADSVLLGYSTDTDDSAIVESFGNSNDFTIDLNGSFIGTNGYSGLAYINGNLNNLTVTETDSFVAGRIEIQGDTNTLTYTSQLENNDASEIYVYTNGDDNIFEIDVQGTGYEGLTDDFTIGGVIVGKNNDFNLNVDSGALVLESFDYYENGNSYYDIDLDTGYRGLLISADASSTDVTSVDFNLTNASLLGGTLELTGGAEIADNAYDVSITQDRSSLTNFTIHTFGNGVDVQLLLDNRNGDQEDSTGGVLNIDADDGSWVTLSLVNGSDNLDINHYGDTSTINLVDEEDVHNYDNNDRVVVFSNDSMTYTNFNNEYDELVIDQENESSSYEAFHWNSDANYQASGDSLDNSLSNVGNGSSNVVDDDGEGDVFYNPLIFAGVNSSEELNLNFGYWSDSNDNNSNDGSWVSDTNSEDLVIFAMSGDDTVENIELQLENSWLENDLGDWDGDEETGDTWGGGWFDDITLVYGSGNDVIVYKWDYMNDEFDLSATLSGAYGQFFASNYVYDDNLVNHTHSYVI